MRSLPVRAVREAVLNGMTHRDRMSGEPTWITWIDSDSRMEVVNPGGFSGGVTAGNVLTQRYARYPALSDLFRALRLVDRQGVGVYEPLHRPFLTLAQAAAALQYDEPDALSAFEAAEQSTVDGEPLIRTSPQRPLYLPRSTLISTAHTVENGSDTRDSLT